MSINDWDGSETVHTYITTYYDVLNINSYNSAYKIKSSVVKYTRNTSQVSVYKLFVRAGQTGSGYYSDGTPTTVDDVKEATYNVPTVLKEYTLNTGFTKYCTDSSFSAAGSNVTTYIKRGTSTWNFKLTANII